MTSDLAVIIPTLNEAETIEKTILLVDAVLTKENLNGQILVVDDNSRDGTIPIVHTLMMTHPDVSILVRQRDHGLSQSIVDGFSEAGKNADILIVMDADGQHPVEKIPEFYRKAREGNDIVIGSRYTAGGEIKNWSFSRRVISRGATFLARVFFPHITDPVSGFFAVRREVVLNAPLKPKGYKILLEVLGKGYWNTVAEIPFSFGPRASGESKLKQQTILEYLEQLLDLLKFTVTNRKSPAYREVSRAVKFMVVGLTGIVVNVGFLFFLTEGFGMYFMLSSLVGIEASILSNFVLNDIWTFGDIPDTRYSRGGRILRFHAVSFGGLLINASTLYFLTTLFGIYYLLSNLVGIFLAFAWNFLVNRRYTWEKA
jgi:dolichol-phosphate mannosyltransferase